MSVDQPHFVYMMTDKANNVLYVGMSSDLARRVQQHKDKLIEGYTKQYNCTKCVYFEVVPDRNSALYREKQIKGWIRVKKARLVHETNPAWRDLFEEIVILQSS